jgi:hypothetical protein
VILSRDPQTGALNYPKYQQYIETCLGFHFWKWDPSFSISHHIRPLEGTQGNPFTSEEQVMELMGPLSNKNFSPNRPHWEYLYVPNYVPAGGGVRVDKRPRTLVIYRIRHDLCDGYSLVKCFVQHTCGDSLDKIMKPVAGSRAKRAPSLSHQVLTGGSQIVSLPFSFLRQIICMDWNVWFLRRSKLTRECHIGMTRKIPVRLVKRISKGHGVTFSTVLFALVGGGIRRFFIRRYSGGNKFPVPDSLQCFTPFPRPKHPDSQLVNHW